MVRVIPQLGDFAPSFSVPSCLCDIHPTLPPAPPRNCSRELTPPGSRLYKRHGTEHRLYDTVPSQPLWNTHLPAGNANLAHSSQTDSLCYISVFGAQIRA